MDRNIKFHKNHPLYHTWQSMKTRCFNKNSNDYKNYGGRGIGIDSVWMIYKNFERDMLSTFKTGLTIERIDNNKGYSKDNCRWATRQEQSQNKRNIRILTYNGLSKNIKQWADYLGINRSTLAQRFYVYKWNLEKCLTVSK